MTSRRRRIVLPKELRDPAFIDALKQALAERGGPVAPAIRPALERRLRPGRLITTHLSQECWRFLLHSLRATSSALSDELRALLTGATPIPALPPDPACRYRVSLLTTDAADLLRYVAETHSALSATDLRRRLSGQCLDDLEAAIRRSSET